MSLLAIFKRLFRPPRKAPLTIWERLEKEHARLFKESFRYTEVDSSYQTLGKQMRKGLYYASGAIYGAGCPEDYPNPVTYLGALLRRLKEARERFNHEEDDPEGFGIGMIVQLRLLVEAELEGRASV